MPDDPSDESCKRLVARIARLAATTGGRPRTACDFEKVVLKQFTRPTGDRTADEAGADSIWRAAWVAVIVYARVTIVQGSPEKIDQGIDSFNTQVLPAAKAVAGYKAAFLLADRQTGKGIGITIWESEDARRRGGEAVDAARAATIEAMGGTVPPVEELEVVASDL